MIAHSLGCAVTHDALHALFTQGLEADPAKKLEGNARAQVLAMVANTSRLLERDIDVYKSVVHPDVNPVRGVADYYLNFKHDWDPFPRPREFRPLQDWPDVATRAAQRFVPVTINAFQSKNIHSLEHYLKNPRVHIPLFQHLTVPQLISQAEQQRAVERYEASTPFGGFEKLHKQLRDLQVEDSASWKTVFQTYREFASILESF